MGQRSQIYVRVNDEDGNKHLVARYFQWNYGERMVSRARGILEWLKSYEDFAYSLCMGENNEKLKRIIDTNFDFKDVVLGQDILKEWSEYLEYHKKKGNGIPAEKFKGLVFDGQDNNDGQLFIDMIVDYKKDKAKFKYGFFLEYDEEHREPIDPEQYMQENIGDSDEPWRENRYMKDSVKYTERNIKYIMKHATLMTEEEALEFTTHNYIKDMGLEVP